VLEAASNKTNRQVASLPSDGVPPISVVPVGETQVDEPLLRCM
jgi:hypothetical protein